MKNRARLPILIALLVSRIICTQEPEMVDVTTLRHTLTQQFNQLKKTLRCATSGKECTEQEISEAQFLIGKIIVAAGVLGAVVLGGIRKGIPAWKRWKVEQKTEKTIQEEMLRNLTGDLLVFYENVVNRDIKAATEQLKKGLILNQYVAQAISMFMAKNQTAAKNLYSQMQKLANNNTLKFASEESDREFWKIFKSAGVIPSDRSRQIQFYRWGGGGMEQQTMSAIGPTL